MPTLRTKNNLVTFVYVGARVWETLTVENLSVRMNYSVSDGAHRSDRERRTVAKSRILVAVLLIA